MPWPTPMHMVASAQRRAALAQFQRRGAGDARAGHAERMAERDGAAIGVHVRGVVGDAEFAQHGDALGGEGLVELDDVEVRAASGRAGRRAFASPGPGRCP